MVRMPRNEIRWQADIINRIILVWKLRLQPVMLGLGLGLSLKARIFGLGLAPCGLKLTSLGLRNDKKRNEQK